MMTNNEPSLNVALDLEMLEKEIKSKEQGRGNAYSDLSGSIGGSKTQQRQTHHTSDPIDTATDFDTLDEPVLVTIKRDARLIGAKFMQVLMPPKNQKSCLEDWDLWGPLFVCVILALLLQGTHNDKGPAFTEAFSLVFFWIVCGNCKY